MKRLAKFAPKPTKKRKITQGVDSLAMTAGTGTFANNPINIVTWNVNGLVAAWKNTEYQKFFAQSFDVLCLNQTKIQKSHIRQCQQYFEHYPYRYWECSTEKNAPGGTALFSNTEPISVSTGIGIIQHDKEGRVITAEFDNFYIVSAYAPSAADKGFTQMDYRVKEWDSDFRAYLKRLQKSGKEVIWLGDQNVVHNNVDIYAGLNETWPGCTMKERKSFANTLKSGFVDTFRELHPDRQEYTSFMSLHDREKNQGVRMVYVLASKGLMPLVQDSIIRDDIPGAKNLPVQLILNKDESISSVQPSKPIATKQSSTGQGTIGVWFRNWLRLHDNAALVEASKNASHIVPFFIMSPSVYDPEYIGANRFYFLLQSLLDLDSQLQKKYGSKLMIFQQREEINDPRGYCKNVIQTLWDQGVLNGVYYEYDSTPYGKERDEAISSLISRKYSDLEFRAFQGHTLTDVERIIDKNNFRNPTTMTMTQNLMEDYFGMTKKSGVKMLNVPEALPPPDALPSLPDNIDTTLNFNCRSLETLHLQKGHLVSQVAKWFPDTAFDPEKAFFAGGETEALRRLQKRVTKKVDWVCRFEKPKTCSTNIGEPSTTGLAPYLALGCISVRKFWNEIEKCQIQKGSSFTQPPQSLNGQLLFREQFYILAAANKNYDKNENNVLCKTIKWGKYNKGFLDAWTHGQTGFPYIDALMRQLQATGWMHHLGRHAVSCFLTRGQLWQNWEHGRDVFDRLLLDSDWAVNTGNWLWLAGVAPFSMPYFRIYDPTPKDTSSSLNYGKGGHDFVRQWVPELRNFPDKYLHEPHLCPEKEQKSCGVIIGRDYPMPIVDKKNARAENLEKFKTSLAARKK